MPSGLPLCQDPDQPTFHEVPEADLDSIHVIQWERDIIWDDPNDSSTAAELRSDAQNGAAAQADGSSKERVETLAAIHPGAGAPTLSPPVGWAPP